MAAAQATRRAVEAMLGDPADLGTGSVNWHEAVARTEERGRPAHFRNAAHEKIGAGRGRARSTTTARGGATAAGLSRGSDGASRARVRAA